jgi:pectin methylesterase-like acyl-CoA thioesterase
MAAALLLAPWSASAQTTGFDTVHVAVPTGEQDADRASILDALEAVQPGGTVLFQPGTYRIGEFIRIPVPGITLQGHREALGMTRYELLAALQRLGELIPQKAQIVIAVGAALISAPRRSTPRTECRGSRRSPPTPGLR